MPGSMERREARPGSPGPERRPPTPPPGSPVTGGTPPEPPRRAETTGERARHGSASPDEPNRSEPGYRSTGAAERTPAPAPPFDLRAEFATAAACSDPLALYDRLDRLRERFEQERGHSSSQAGTAAERDETGGSTAFSGELGEQATAAPRRAEPASGALPLPQSPAREQRRRTTSERSRHAERPGATNGAFSGALPVPTEQPLPPERAPDVDQRASSEEPAEHPATPEEISPDTTRVSLAGAATPESPDEPGAGHGGPTGAPPDPPRGHVGMTGSFRAETADPPEERTPERVVSPPEVENPTTPLGDAADILGQEHRDDSAGSGSADPNSTPAVAESGTAPAASSPPAGPAPVVPEPGPTAAEAAPIAPATDSRPPQPPPNQQPPRTSSHPRTRGASPSRHRPPAVSGPCRRPVPPAGPSRSRSPPTNRRDVVIPRTVVTSRCARR
ncbi:hypothetical protein CDG81_02220 [Actinopolyspora erythraea]|uniref:Uncharacterized protein n=2 Tax=Actinopolyspora erythraea TaxID=414996 RepID=A0A223RNH8_9ACTN|nr:hypothetical protein CDG81_02220 [Actinopolyspora erythraea]